MEVGTVREKIIVAFFIYKFGAENVKTEIPTTEPEIDVEIFGKAVSIKTISGKRLNGVKLIWTVDRIKARYFFDKYQPHYDMVLIQVNWSNEGAFFYVPLEVQLEVFNSLGKERYLKLPVEGTNPRGVEISGESMRIISMHPDTLKVPIFWNKNYIMEKGGIIMKKGTSTSAFGTNGRINHDSSKFYDSKLYTELKGKEITDRSENDLSSKIRNKLILGSAENMKELPDNSVHLMITSPPYNVSKEYDADLSLEEYLQMLENSFAETYRVLVNGGRACINIANLGRKPYIPLSDYISKLMIKIGFNMRGEIIWNKAASASPSTAWGSWQSAANPILRDVHEYILVFSKGDFKRERKQKVNTITRDQFMEWTKSIWNMNAESARRVGHPAPFPVEMPFRLIQLYSFKEDIVLDPFIGSGTTAIAALKSERYFVGYDISSEYIALAEKRIAPFKKQTALTFQIDKSD